MTAEDTQQERFVVVRNDEEQYSIWPCSRPLPAGWHPQAMQGSKQECLDCIERVWTDMRPLTLRRQMDAGR